MLPTTACGTEKTNALNLVPAMKHFNSVVNVLAVLFATLTFVSPTFGETNEARGVVQEPGAKHQQLSPSEMKVLDASEGPSSMQTQNSGVPRERLSLEERRQLRRDINDAGRDIYRQDRTERPRRF